jgi:hypothetical protein
MSAVQYHPALIGAVLLSGCAAHSAWNRAPTGSQPGPELRASPLGLPGLPPARRASVESTTEVAALDTYDRSANAVDLDTRLLLNSSVGTTSWAPYEFNYGLEFLTRVEVLLSVSGLSEVYVAVGDYSTDNWDVRGPFSTSEVISLDQAANRNSDGGYHLAVLTSGGDSATLLKLIATVDNGWTIVTVEGSLAAGAGPASTARTAPGGDSSHRQRSTASGAQA